jgi:alkaline phosphatase D
MGKGETVALEFVGGSISSQSLGETDLDASSGVTIEGNDSSPNTPTAIIDHHGFGQITVDTQGLRCEMVVNGPQRGPFTLGEWPRGPFSRG